MRKNLSYDAWEHSEKSTPVMTNSNLLTGQDLSSLKKQSTMYTNK